MQIIELDPAVWMRGGGNGELLCLDKGQRRQCCIGIACTVFGVSDRDIASLGAIADLAEEAGLGTVPEPFKQIGFASLSQMLDDRLESVYAANDDPDISDDAERVANINAELERLGADFRFVLKEQK